MMKSLALQLPGINGNINFTAPRNIPTGGPGTLANIIATGFDLAIMVAVIVCLFSLILSGFNWITSEGDKQKVANARQRLAMSIIGLIIIFLSFIIINTIYGFFFGSTVNFLGSF